MASLVDESGNYRQFKGFQPAADYLRKSIREEIFSTMLSDYKNLLQARLPSEVVNKVRGMAEEAGLVMGRFSKKPFFVTDEDVGTNGATGSAFALVKPGERDAPLRVAFAHTDIPCLRITPQPIYIESDADRSLAYPSIKLLTEPYGGIRVEDWYGLDVDVIGNIYGDKNVKINLPGRIKQKSVHVEDSDDKKTFFGLKIETGYRTIKEVYKAFKIKDSMDFGRGKLYVFPHFHENGRLVGNELGALGQDDHSGIWASSRAGLEAILGDTPNTLLIFGLDKEEVGSSGSSGAYNGFFEAVTKKVLNSIHKRKVDLPLELSLGLMQGMPALSVDGDVALGDPELDETPYLIDLYNTSKIGWGFFLSSNGPLWENRNVSSKHIGRLISLFDSHLGKRARDRYQIIGKPTTPDSELDGGGTMADKFDKFLPCVDMGVPMIGTHHPLTETINVYDLFWAKEALRVYFEN